MKLGAIRDQIAEIPIVIFIELTRAFERVPYFVVHVKQLRVLLNELFLSYDCHVLLDHLQKKVLLLHTLVDGSLRQER